MEDLFTFLTSIQPISTRLKQYLVLVLKEKEFKKKAYLLKEGQVCRNIYFIKKGLLRCFYVENGNEISSWFMKAGDVVISVESFYKQTSSKEHIQALEDTTVFYIDYTDLQFIYLNYPEFNFIGRLLTENYYALSEERLYALRLKKAVSRYRFLLETHPELIQLVPAKYLSSYLGINEETYSRIKGQV